MDKQTILIITIIVVAVAAVGALLYFFDADIATSGDRVEGSLTLQELADKTGCQAPESGPLDDFTQCIKDKGALFYGAFWCPHCEDQKKLFGDAAQYLPYVECSTPDSKGQLAVCASQCIKVYPTWVFPTNK